MPSREKIAAAVALATAFTMTSAFAVPNDQPAATTQARLAAQLPRLSPLAVAWAEGLARGAAKAGVAPSPALEALARRVGVREPDRIRIVVLDEIPLPEDPLLKGAALSVGLSQSDAAGMTLGHAVFLRRGYEHDIRVMSHEFRHVAQYEASGGIAGFLGVHLADLVAFGYEDSPFEVDARAHEVAALPVAAHPASPSPPARRGPQQGS